MAAPSRSTPGMHIQWRAVLYLFVMAAVLYVVVPQLGVFQLRLPSLTIARAGWLLAAVVALAASFVLATSVYYQLSNRLLPFGRTVAVQLAGLFVNRLLPAGSGALGVSYLYLRHQRFDRGTAIALVTANNLLGFIGHGVMLVCLALFVPAALPAVHFPEIDGTMLALGGIGLAAGIGILLRTNLIRRPLQRLGREMARAFQQLRARPVRLGLALLSSLGLTLCYVFCLYASAQALGIMITPLEAFIVLTFSIAAATVVPLPGGLGAAEAGVVAGLVSFGVTAASALAIALLYRFITFWLALAAGAVSFTAVLHRGYLGDVFVGRKGHS